MSKKYYYVEPLENDATWHMYGLPLKDVVAVASKVAAKTGQIVPVSYEDINACGTVKETGDAAICHPTGWVERKNG